VNPRTSSNNPNLDEGEGGKHQMEPPGPNMDEKLPVLCAAPAAPQNVLHPHIFPTTSIRLNGCIW
jgi:hypothetical protein